MTMVAMAHKDAAQATSRKDRSAASRPGILHRILWWIETRRLLHELYQLDAHTLRDMGLDPKAVYRRREGAIGDMRGNSFCAEEAPGPGIRPGP